MGGSIVAHIKHPLHGPNGDSDFVWYDAADLIDPFQQTMEEALHFTLIASANDRSTRCEDSRRAALRGDLANQVKVLGVGSWAYRSTEN